jgi:hypothetical protein
MYVVPLSLVQGSSGEAVTDGMGGSGRPGVEVELGKDV